MSDEWSCAECGTMFPERRGKIRVLPPTPETRKGKICQLFQEISLGIRYYEIHCPHCGYVIVGEDDV